MGMNFGASQDSDDPKVLVSMNTTPLIDVMLVLLVMLIITIPIQTHAVKIDVPPKSNTPPPPMPSGTVDLVKKSPVHAGAPLATT